MTDYKRHGRGTDMANHVETLADLSGSALRAVELGVRTGVSTGAILAGLPPAGRLWSVDVDNCRMSVPQFIRDDSRWTFIHGDDRDDAPWNAIPDGIDLAFIDSSHEYHHTLYELKTVADKGANVIAMHDWNLPDVADAVRGFVDRTEYRIVGIQPSRWGFIWIAR